MSTSSEVPRRPDLHAGPAQRVMVVTGSRADFGLLEGTCARLAAQDWCQLQVVVSGMHLLEEHGDTVREVARQFPVAGRVPLRPDEDSRAGMGRAVADGLRGFVEKLQELSPHLVVVLGDRTEVCAAALGASYLGIPIAHLHGGDRSGNDIDDLQRDIVARCAALHFPATPRSAQRLRALGVTGPIQVVGAPGLDAILRRPVPPRAQVAETLAIPSDRPWMVVVQHPLPQDSARRTFEVMTEVLVGTGRAAEVDGAVRVTISPNNDAGHSAIQQAIQQALANARNPADLRWYPSLARAHYLDLLSHAAVLVGNSSSGIIEGHALGVPVVNIGSRQDGRERDLTVVDCLPTARSIEHAIAHARTDPELQARRAEPSLYGDGRAAEHIVHGIHQALIAGHWSPAGDEHETHRAETQCS